MKTVAIKATPWQTSAPTRWNDYADARACEWLQHQGILVSSNIAAEAVQTVAKESRFHPVQDYLRKLSWDGKSRIDHWLSRYLGVKDTLFTRAVGARWLISAVARIFQPGCQVDHTLLLEGAQGIRKSSSLRVLAGDEFFADHLADLGNKDSRLDLLGVWIVELSELDNVRRGELERVKAFLTARVDHFRPPYGRRTEDVARSCVFAATVNDETPFIDATGNRRFWPVRCGDIATDELAKDRDQLWSEALWQFEDGRVWWLDSAELNYAAEAEQDERYECGVWDEVILPWLDEPTQGYEQDGRNSIPITPFNSTKDRVTVIDILRHCLGKPLDRCSQADKNQVVRCLKHAGWKRKQERSGPLRGTWFYVRPDGTSVEPVAEPDASR
jgi:predicted P-loop ATPase